MTFPKIELLCPQCKESMTLIDDKAKLIDCNVKGYDKMVQYHFQCKANERAHQIDDTYYKAGTEWCDISTEKQIAVFRILIPKIGDDNYSGSVSTATQTEKNSSFLKNWFK